MRVALSEELLYAIGSMHRIDLVKKVEAWSMPRSDSASGTQGSFYFRESSQNFPLKLPARPTEHSDEPDAVIGSGVRRNYHSYIETIRLPQGSFGQVGQRCLSLHQEWYRAQRQAIC